MSHKIDQEIEELASKLEKSSGERGAVIMGYTPSGKPKYQSNLQAQENWRERHKKPGMKKTEEKDEESEKKEESVEVKKAEEEVEVKEIIKGIVDKARELGPEGLKKAAETMTDEQKNLLGKILTKAVSLDKEALVKPKNVKDLDSHEIPKKGQDDEDEKLVKPAADEQKHQGDNSPEGIEGQVIKSEDKPKIQGAVKEYEKNAKDPHKEFEKGSEKDEVKIPKKEFKEEHKKLVSVLESDSKEDDKKEAKKQKKELEEVEKAASLKKGDEMKKELEEISKSDEKLAAMCKRCKEKGKSKEEFVKKSQEFGFDVERVSKIWDAANAEAPKAEPVKKSVVWNDLQSDLFGSTHKRGRNHNFSKNNDEIEAQEKINTEVFKKGEYVNESLVKSEGFRPTKINDLIEKGLDTASDRIEHANEMLEFKKTKNPTALQKSFSDEELAAMLGIDSKKAEEILGKK